jgi:endonuclease/exonuclease/phosphatase (EEP) superfamily protein YafD
MHFRRPLRTPEASSITSYPFGEDRETLLLANVHAINVSLGTGAFKVQLERIAGAMRNHEGPIVFAGDSNTWDKDRVELVFSLTNELDLQEVSFDDSARKTVFGYPLDRIFWRGMAFDKDTTEPLASSDHDALIASWHLQ